MVGRATSAFCDAQYWLATLRRSVLCTLLRSVAKLGYHRNGSIARLKALANVDAPRGEVQRDEAEVDVGEVAAVEPVINPRHDGQLAERAAIAQALGRDVEDAVAYLFGDRRQRQAGEDVVDLGDAAL